MQTTESIISLYLILELLCSALKIPLFCLCNSQPYCYSTQILGYMLERNLQVCVECGSFFQQEGFFPLSAFKGRRKCGNNFPKSIMEYSWLIHFSCWTTPLGLKRRNFKRRGQGVFFQYICLSCGPSCYETPLKQLQQESSFCSLPYPPLFLPPSPPPHFLSCGSRPGK